MRRQGGGVYTLEGEEKDKAMCGDERSCLDEKVAAPDFHRQSVWSYFSQIESWERKRYFAPFTSSFIPPEIVSSPAVYLCISRSPCSGQKDRSIQLQVPFYLISFLSTAVVRML